MARDSRAAHLLQVTCNPPGLPDLPIGYRLPLLNAGVSPAITRLSYPAIRIALAIQPSRRGTRAIHSRSCPLTPYDALSSPRVSNRSADFHQRPGGNPLLGNGQDSGRIQTTRRCLRYTGCPITGVSVSSSPDPLIAIRNRVEDKAVPCQRSVVAAPARLRARGFRSLRLTVGAVSSVEPSGSAASPGAGNPGQRARVGSPISERSHSSSNADLLCIARRPAGSAAGPLAHRNPFLSHLASGSIRR